MPGNVGAGGGGAVGAGSASADATKERAARLYADGISSKFRSMKNGTAEDRDTKDHTNAKVLFGPVSARKSDGDSGGELPVEGTGIILYSSVPDTLLVLPGQYATMVHLEVGAVAADRHCPAPPCFPLSSPS